MREGHLGRRVVEAIGYPRHQRGLRGNQDILFGVRESQREELSSTGQEMSWCQRILELLLLSYCFSLHLRVRLFIFLHLITEQEIKRLKLHIFFISKDSMKYLHGHYIYVIHASLFNDECMQRPTSCFDSGPRHDDT